MYRRRTHFSYSLWSEGGASSRCSTTGTEDIDRDILKKENGFEGKFLFAQAAGGILPLRKLVTAAVLMVAQRIRRCQVDDNLIR